MIVLAAPDPVHLHSAPFFAVSPALPSVLSRLRLETRSEHASVERVPHLMGALTDSTCRQRLAQFHGFFSPMEGALKTCRALQHDSHDLNVAQLAMLLPRLHKSRLLRHDLQRLGVSTAGLTQFRSLPPIQTLAGVLGCLYVLEGAMLGGRMITQHVQANFPGDTARMWNAMRQTLLPGAQCAGRKRHVGQRRCHVYLPARLV